MSRLVVICLFFLLSVSELFAAGHCGTAKFIEERRSHPSTFKLSALTRLQDAGSCSIDDYYDSVYTRKTEHFQIFYTLDGPHKTSAAYIDSLAIYAENAWTFHTKKMEMKAPLGAEMAYHFQQAVEDKLYPIEVVDIDLMCKTTGIFKGRMCHGCFGLTISDDAVPGASELFLDNDFKYTAFNAVKDTIEVNGRQCPYPTATEELENTHHEYSYFDRWDIALRVTTIHELYHAVQLRYLDMSYWTLWFEASASGIEEIAEPDIDDYYAYLPGFFSSMGTSLSDLQEEYGIGIFFIYLYNHIDKKADKFIWENFEKYPSQPFEKQFHDFAVKKKLSADSLFHDFASRLAFAGKKSGFVDSTYWITNDQKTWPDFEFFSNEKDEYFDPSIEKFSYKFYTRGEPNLENFRGMVNAVLFSGQDASIYKLKNTNEVNYILAVKDSGIDSIAWIFSRFTTNSLMPTQIASQNLHAYPTPWRQGKLCFTPLPQNKKFIEIRNRRGDLIVREPYEGLTHCIEEEKVKSLMLPGVYQFRAGNAGKTKPFLIVY